MYKKDMFVKPCLKRHAFLVRPLGVSSDFLQTPTLMFFRPPKKKREAQTKKRARNLAPAWKFRSPRPPKGGPFRPKRRPKGEGGRAFRVLRDETGLGLAGHLVFAVLLVPSVSRLRSSVLPILLPPTQPVHPGLPKPPEIVRIFPGDWQQEQEREWSKRVGGHEMR